MLKKAKYGTTMVHFQKHYGIIIVKIQKHCINMVHVEKKIIVPLLCILQTMAHGKCSNNHSIYHDTSYKVVLPWYISPIIQNYQLQNVKTVVLS